MSSDDEAAIRDAASLVVIDFETQPERILMGRRASGHLFMPGVFVFPGGRLDEADAAAEISAPLAPEARDALGVPAPGRQSDAAPHALAVTALRELHEETGLSFGATTPDTFALDHLKFFARAITPPGRVRRYDTRFFAAARTEALQPSRHAGPDGELQEIDWFSLAELADMQVAGITRQILRDVAERLEAGPIDRWPSRVWLHSHDGDAFLRTRLA